MSDKRCQGAQCTPHLLRTSAQRGGACTAGVGSPRSALRLAAPKRLLNYTGPCSEIRLSEALQRASLLNQRDHKLMEQPAPAVQGPGNQGKMRLERCCMLWVMAATLGRAFAPENWYCTPNNLKEVTGAPKHSVCWARAARVAASLLKDCILPGCSCISKTRSTRWPARAAASNAGRGCGATAQTARSFKYTEREIPGTPPTAQHHRCITAFKSVLLQVQPCVSPSQGRWPYHRTVLAKQRRTCQEQGPGPLVARCGTCQEQGPRTPCGTMWEQGPGPFVGTMWNVSGAGVRTGTAEICSQGRMH